MVWDDWLRRGSGAIDVFAQISTHMRIRVHSLWRFLQWLCGVYFFIYLFIWCALAVGHLHAPADFSACCGIWRSERDPPSITALSSSCLAPLLLASLPLPWPHYSSLAPRELLWQLIISWHKAERWRLQPPHPAAPWGHKVTTFTFRAQIVSARCHQAEMQGQQLFPVRPPPLCLPPPALFHSVLLSLSQPLSRLLTPWHPPTFSPEMFQNLLYLSKSQTLLLTVNIETILLWRHAGWWHYCDF